MRKKEASLLILGRCRDLRGYRRVCPFGEAIRAADVAHMLSCAFLIVDRRGDVPRKNMPKNSGAQRTVDRMLGSRSGNSGVRCSAKYHIYDDALLLRENK